MSIQQVPKDVLLNALSYLSLEEALKIKSVSKEWYEFGETAAKPLIEKEFHDMVNRTSFLFKKMTGKTVYEFVPKLNEKLDLSTFTSKKLHDHFETVPLKVYCYVETHYSQNRLIVFSPESFQLKHEIEVKEEKQYIPLTFTENWNCNVMEYPLGSFQCFPKELFEINEKELTAFPLQGRLVICKAFQILRTFEDEMKLLSITREVHDGPRTYYVWQRDAIPNVIQKSDLG
ncbi:MAG TPA: F-box protein [Rhabdochlamydiaceae bacterium]|nr:F-box protein [Rhabdochlamydiaceae bacterium]